MGNSGSTYHREATRPADLVQQLSALNTQAAALTTKINTAAEPVNYCASKSELHAKFLQKVKEHPVVASRLRAVNDPNERLVGFIGPISVGKTSLLNSLTGSTEEVRADHTTIKFKEVIKRGNIVYYDVPGNNPDFNYNDMDKMSLIKAMDLVLILCTTDVKDCEEIILLCDALKVPFVFCQTKCDIHSASQVEVQPLRTKVVGDLQKLLSKQVESDVFMISARNKKKAAGDLFDWNRLVSRIDSVTSIPPAAKA